MSILPVFNSDSYEDGRTKQAFKDSTDINKILDKAQRTGTISHLQKHGAMYGDFTDVPDLLEAQARLKKAQAVFDELPSEIRKEFHQDWAMFFEFVNNPANKDDLQRVLPALAKPGRQMVAPMRTAITEAIRDGFESLRAPAEPAPVEPSGGSE